MSSYIIGKYYIILYFRIGSCAYGADSRTNTASNMIGCACKKILGVCTYAIWIILAIEPTAGYIK